MSKAKNIYKIVSLLLVLNLILSLFSIGIPYVFATDTLNDFEATLYNTGDITGTGVQLTSDSDTTISLSSDYNMLTIDWTFTRKQSHTLDITVPAGMYIHVADSTKREDDTRNLESVTMITLDNDENAEGYQQGTGIYFNEETGTLRYVTSGVDYLGDDATDSTELKVFIAFDQALWPKHSDSVGTPLTLETALTVSMDGGALVKDIDKVTTAAYENYNTNIEVVGDTTSFPLSLASQSLFHIRITTAGQEFRRFVYDRIEVTYSTKIYRVGTDGEYPTTPVENLHLRLYTGSSGMVDNGDGTYSRVYEDFDEESSHISLGNIGGFLSVSDGIRADDKIEIYATVKYVSYLGYERTINLTPLAIYPRAPVPRIDTYSAANKTVVSENWYGDNTDIIDCLGCITLINEGMGPSPADSTVTVEFDTERETGDAPRLKVRAYNVPLPAGVTTDINVTTVDDNGNTYEHIVSNAISESSANGYWLSVDSFLTPEEKNDGINRYIYKIEYVIGSIPAGAQLYRYQYDIANDSAGSFWGTVNGEWSGQEFTSRITYTDSEGVGSTYGEVQTKVQTAIQYINTSLHVKENSIIYSDINAGSTVNFSFQVGTSDYPYSQTQYVPKPVMFFVAPKDVTLVDAKIAGETAVITGRQSGNDTIYTLEFQNGFGRAYIDENGKWAHDGFRDAVITLKGADVLSLGKYRLRDRLLLSNASDVLGTKYYNSNQLYGSYSLYQISDSLFDVDNDNNKNEYFGGIADADVNNAEYFSTIPSGSRLSVEVGVRNFKMDEDNYVSGTGFDRAVNVRTGDDFYYRLQIKNGTPSPIPYTNSAIYIPIMQAGVKLPNDMGGLVPDVGLRLKKAITVNGTDYWDIRYSMDATEDNYSNNSHDFTYDEGGATWYTAEEMEEMRLWHKVTMVKVVIDPNKQGGSIPVGGTSELLVTVAAKPFVPGTTALWASAVWNRYNLESKEDPNMIDTNYTRIITNTKKVNDPTDPTPDDMGEDKNYILNVNVSPSDTNGYVEFGTSLLDLGQTELKVYKVEGKNLTLASKEAIQENIKNDTRPSITEQDETFALTITKIDKSAQIDVYNVSETNHVSIGNTNEASQTYFGMKIFHYGNFINSTTDRVITLFLRDDIDSIESTIEIRIKRELSAIDAKTGIAPGKIYNNIGTDEKTAAISKNSAFTAQFVLKDFVPSNYGEATLTFSHQIPTWSRLILIDQTDTSNPTFYSFQTRSTKYDTLPLTSFKELQSSDSYFSLGDDSEARDKNLLIIFDFTESGNENQTDTTLNLQVPMAEGMEGTPIDESLDVIISGSRGFNTGIEDAQYQLTDKMKFTVNLNSTIPANHDAKFLNLQQALILSIEGVEFPAGAYIEYQNRQYTPLPDNNQIIVPIGVIQASQAAELELCTPYIKLTDGEYTLNVERWISKTSLPDFPMGGRTAGETLPVTFTVQNNQPALKLDMGEDRIVTATEAGAGISLLITRHLIDETTPLTLNVDRKDGDLYTDYTTLTNITGNSYNAILSDIPIGTYRFTLSDGNGTNATLHFIVVE